MSPEDRLLFARIVLKNNLASEAEVKACIEEAEERLRKGQKVPITDIFLRRKLLEKGQVRAVLDALRQTHQVQALNRKISGYQFITELGHGTAGTVYLARQLSMGREVAIKVLNEDVSDDPDFIEKFHREAKSAARLNHPHVIQAIDVGEGQGVHYFVMEYVEGESLQRILKRDGRIDDARAADFALQVCKALQHAHRHGLIHRDIKPGNILINAQGTAKLCDLGLARPVGSQATSTATGRTAGTPAYMSPEQALGKPNLDVRTDIYSLGATLYHAVTGKIPFVAHNLPELLTLLVRGEFKPPRDLCPEIAEATEHVILQMMATERSRRPASPEDIQALFEDLLAQLPPAPPLVLQTPSGKQILPPTGLSRSGEFRLPVLLAISGTDAGKRFVLTRNRMLAGRLSTADIRLHDVWISRHQFHILQDQAGIRIEALTDSNATEVNGLPVRVARLKPGDVISIFKTSLKLEFEAPS
ncbi:MAG: protein kinase [Planctomycetes bacterium]|nr:protein kinase [Planctomycetota bacterium]